MKPPEESIRDSDGKTEVALHVFGESCVVRRGVGDALATTMPHGRDAERPLGGDVDGATVLLPDPMGATGGSIDHAIRYYKNSVPGTARRFVAVFLTCTPEAIQRLLEAHDDVHIVALRLDRGLSSEQALMTRPGQMTDERGLTDHQYIVPGAGGVGEVLNNSFV